jgi:site-specific recombinase XerD
VSTGAKGGKGRVVPLPRRAELAVVEYLAERAVRRDRAGLGELRDGDRLFVRNDERPFDVSFLDRLIRRLARSGSVALPRDAAAHAFRHQLGVQLALRRTQVPVIQRVLGHADSRTTSVYTDIAAHDLADALDDAGWL